MYKHQKQIKMTMTLGSTHYGNITDFSFQSSIKLCEELLRQKKFNLLYPSTPIQQLRVSKEHFHDFQFS